MNPEGTRTLEFLRRHFFLSPSGDTLPELLDQIACALRQLDHQKNEGPLSAAPPNASVLPSQTPHTVLDPKAVIEELPRYFSNAIRASSPYMVKNIIPLPGYPAIATSVATSLLMANAASAEDAGNLLSAELRCAAFLSTLLGIDPQRSAGFFTWGGTATNFYAMKLGLFKVLPNHGRDGLRGEPIAVLDAWASHYSHKTAANWLGIGEQNLIAVKSNADQTTNLESLSSEMQSLLERGLRIACIFCQGGTTSNVAIDNVSEIRTLVNDLVKKYGLAYTPHIHADTVTGWAYTVFRHYDCSQNKFGIEGSVVNHIRNTLLPRLNTLSHADSFGFDFHKTGYCPYVASLFLARDQNELTCLRKKKDTTPIFQEGADYNPGLTFTMETSRSSATILGAWINLLALGVEGLQLLLARSLENAFSLRTLLESPSSKGAGLHVVNNQFYGTDIYLRIYPPSANDPSSIHAAELSDRNLLTRNDGYLVGFHEFLRTTSLYRDSICLSCSSAAFYTPEGHPVRALRIYLLNPFIERVHLQDMHNTLMKASHDYRARLKSVRH